MALKKFSPVEWLLRLALSAGMLSAVADRFGFWPKEISAWGNWQAFSDYTQKLNPWVPGSLIHYLAGFATLLEICFAIMLLLPFRTIFFAKATGVLMLLFFVSMAINLGIKAPLDYSVLANAAAAFGLAEILVQKKKNLSLDN